MVYLGEKFPRNATEKEDKEENKKEEKVTLDEDSEEEEEREEVKGSAEENQGPYSDSPIPEMIQSQDWAH